MPDAAMFYPAACAIASWRLCFITAVLATFYLLLALILPLLRLDCGLLSFDRQCYSWGELVD